MRRLLPLLFLTLAACSSVGTDPDQIVPPDTTLRGASAGMGLYIGAAVGTGLTTSDVRYAQVLGREFSLLTPENDMKPGPLRPTQTTWNWGPADAHVEFAEARSMAVRGHTLVWHQSTPSWMTASVWTNAQAETNLREHILAVVGRWKGRIAYWDVVNEAIADDGTLRDTYWSRTLGPDYIEKAFRWAHEADPSVKLFYNDYSAEGTGRKSDAVFNLVKDLVQKGVPIDGVGLQMHVTASNPPPKAEVAWNMRRIADLGLEVHITEMDVRIPIPATESGLVQQAVVYRDMLDTCIAASNCTAFILWGFTDRHSWVPGFFEGFGDALIFDTEYRPKLAYTVMRDGLAESTRVR